VHNIYFSQYTGGPITIQCSNYNNPIYSTVVTGFSITIVDREEPTNNIATYPSWQFTANNLLPRKLSSELTFEFFLDNSDTPTSPVPIQTEVGISISFNMDTIPIDDTGCFVKYTFPNDMAMVSLPYTYQGYDMMSKPGGSSNLILKDQVFINNQAYDKGNFIIFKGCQDLTGTGRVPKIKVSGPITPSAQKDTGEFTVEVFKSFSESSYQLSNLIVQGSGFIEKSMFTSGALRNGVFTGLIPFIQTSATHTLQWTL